MGELKEAPKRRDGTYRVFWYDRDAPGHIFHRAHNGDIYRICVGHGEEESKAWT